MRAADMEVGRLYALECGRPSGPAKVEMLDTELPRRGRVLIKFLDGVPKGREVVVLSRQVLHEWGKAKPKPRPRRPKKPEPPPLAVGSTVEWSETGPIPWKVERLDRERGTATLEGEIFGGVQERAALVDELTPVSDEPDPDRDRSAREAVEEALGQPVEPRPSERRDERTENGSTEPELPDDAKLRLIEQLIFSPKLLERYRKHFAPKKRRYSVEEQLRRELRRRGRLRRLPPWAKRRKQDEYLRIRVANRYEIIVPESPSAQEATGYVTEIVGVGQRRGRRAKGKGPAGGRNRQRRGRRPSRRRNG